ncbi:MAG: type III pantothenate kinase [Phycisphaerae bacterium]|nr:type III pantothenate kinase [Phycisphaerae bacterium]
MDTDRSTGLVVVDIGNSSLHLGVWSDEGVAGVVRIDHEDWTGLDAALRGLVPNSRKADLAAAVVACVVPDALERAEQAISDALGLKALVVGRDVFRPLRLAVNDPEAVGIDRVCSAAAAYAKVGGGCTVVDFGTAVTVDLVDDDGVFQGGAILPGLRLQAVALGNHTSALPVVSARFPEHPVGKDTTEAICSGICYGMAGAVRGLVEGFAARLNRWPYVVATGGDAAMMAEHCDFIDTVVTDLCLYGVGHAYVKHLNSPPGE